ncbi:hypothetical protein CK203_085349 [Vitis vinifera]|uniref:Uncharacterized protein n=1 Tax=Vitis vinifera TaxID=29760 RepID=A0A438DCZ3_VITVI|nr:hypothetical protein CK203_085349 [Vitis vinifera]
MTPMHVIYCGVPPSLQLVPAMLGCLHIKLLLWFKFIGTMKIYNLSSQTMKKAQLTKKSSLDILEECIDAHFLSIPKQLGTQKLA